MAERMSRVELESLEREGGWVVLDLVREVKRLRGLVRGVMGETVDGQIGATVDRPYCGSCAGGHPREGCPLGELEEEGRKIGEEEGLG